MRNKSILDSMRDSVWDWGLLILLAGLWGWFEWYPYGDWLDACRGGLLGAGAWAIVEAGWGIFGKAVDRWEDRRSRLETPGLFMNRHGKPFEFGQDATDQICGTCWLFNKPGCPKKIYEKNRPACAHWHRMMEQE